MHTSTPTQATAWIHTHWSSRSVCRWLWDRGVMVFSMIHPHQGSYMLIVYIVFFSPWHFSNSRTLISVLSGVEALDWNVLCAFSSVFLWTSLCVYIYIFMFISLSFSPLFPPYLPHLIPLTSHYLLLAWFSFSSLTPLSLFLHFWPSVCKARWACWGSERFWEPLWLFSVLCVCARPVAVVRSSLPFQWMWVEAWCLNNFSLPQQETQTRTCRLFIQHCFSVSVCRLWKCHMLHFST